ncbi:MAG: anhydro-N-acetylmuramic acid kinase [Bacteroidota bacterium]|nr:anhydro-N-acetylmuramic acid kinase [Bacteroidota bacterium]
MAPASSDLTSSGVAPSRLVAGCMSGTSLDGVDVALARFSGSERSIRVETLGSFFTPYPDSLRTGRLLLADPSTDSETLASRRGDLNAELASVYARAVRSAMNEAAIPLDQLDAVGNHGQTVLHAPERGVTVQLGDPCHMADLLQTTVVGDFRQADVALGGEGAPLVPYMDWALFTHDVEHRLLLNLGGIANVTSLPPECDRDEVLAFDTGPANMLLDALVQKLTGQPMDRDGALAARGTPDPQVVEALLSHSYFHRHPPKSTGRELFSAAYVKAFLDLTTHLRVEDRLATAAEVTVQSVARAIRDFIPGRPVRMWVSGGGVHNRSVMAGLQQALTPVVVEPLSTIGLDPDAKEALCFALLAHEALNGVATGMPSVTGARGRAFSGKICKPGTTGKA